MGRSLAQQVAALGKEEQQKVLEEIDPEALLFDWGFWARPEQRPPQTMDWSLWLYLAGRGAGKTRSAGEWIRDKARKPKTRIHLVGRTSADVRDVMILGESGLLSICAPSEAPDWQPSKRLLTWPNGSQATVFSSVEPDQLRGPQAEYTWADEAAAWPQVPDASGLTAFDNARIANRLGEHPQMVVTTTPKRVPLMRTLLDEADETGDVVISRGRTLDNAGNLSRSYLNTILGVYSGTSLARQELEGELLDDVEGALWTLNLVEKAGRTRLLVIPTLRVIGVDPSVAEHPRDECGIVVAGATADRMLHKRYATVLEDCTVHGSPNTWAKAVVAAHKRWGAPVVAEGNQGGALVADAIANIDPTVPVHIVHARVNKQTRAEPVVGAYEQGRVQHLNYLPELESQMTSWIPADSKKSPDRVDALVWALTALLVKPPPGLRAPGPLRAQSPSQRRLPSTKPNRQRAARRGGLRRVA